ncbi:MAG: 3-phosphoshikimate 1-carboxyvinyltransferase [Deltaproteobacteria bacterium]|nr:MAG: 3-phosphoshikimate 1-carboxyvinyltransferase [Deltaproteobacteria bacterium]
MRVAPPPAGLTGGLDLPGDKSIAHRALLLGALAEGTTVLSGVPGGADVRATLAAVQTLGAQVSEQDGALRIHGQGPDLGVKDRVAIDCANSGTTMRLVAGLAAGGAGMVVLDGDASLRRRPMERVAEPLRAMHAIIETTAGHAPMTVRGGTLVAIDWHSPVASAQVKSAILLAGLRARGTTTVREPLPSRDHTERLLAHLGAQIERRAGAVTLAGGQRLRGASLSLPGDVSSAAFLVVAGLLVPGSAIRLRDVGINPTRTGFLAILRRMGAVVDVIDAHDAAGEPRGELRVTAAALHGTTIAPEEVPAAIDELPVLAVAAALAEGETVLRGASELRVKESDRIAALEQLRPLGVSMRTTSDGFVIQGTAGRRLRGGRIDARGDHRVAMAFAVAGLVADGGVEIRDPECVDVSFPGFFARLAELGAQVEPR